MALVRKRMSVRGCVQGVGFRYAFAEHAQALRLNGWVRNRSDGSVEAVVQGESEAVERMIEWANTGPDLAQVEEVIVSEAEVCPEPGQRGEFKRFEIRRTVPQ